MPSASTATRPDITFVDTNVLVDVHDASESTKQRIARSVLEELWAERRGVMYSAWPVVVIGPTAILYASRLEERYQLSFWDALIVEAARLAGAQRLLTEDLQAGRVVGGVRVEDPFVQLPASG